MSNEKEYFTMYEGKKIGLMPPFRGESNFYNDKPTENNLNKNLLGSMLGNKKSLKLNSIGHGSGWGLEIPDSYLIHGVDSKLEPKDQGSHNSCGPHAFSYALELLNYRKTGEYIQLSTDFLYGCSNIYDESNKNNSVYNEDAWAAILGEDDLIQRVTRYGDVPISDLHVGNATPLNCRRAIEANSRDYLEKARKYRIYGGFELLTIEEIKGTVYSDTPVVIAINITGQDDATRHFSYDPKVEKTAGHFLCVVGYNKEGLLAFNSWSTNKSKSIWTVEDGVEIKSAVALVNFDVENNKNDFDKLVKDSYKIETTSKRAVFGANKKYAEYLMSQFPLETGSYQESSLTFKAELMPSKLSDSWPLPIKPYQNMGSSTDITTSRDIGRSLGLCIDGLLLARNDDYVACSAGAVLCHPGNYTKRRYPLFLTDGHYLDTEIEYFNGHSDHKFGLKKAVILAGPAIIPDSVLNNLEYESKVRIYGQDRVGTAVEIAKLSRGSDTIILVNQYDYPDLVCAGALGAKLNAPILVNDSSNNLDMKNKNFLSNFGARKAIIIGGPALISSSVESALRNLVGNVKRVYGSDRYDTSVQIINRCWSNFDTIVLARGDEFKNMSSAAMLAANFDAPVLLTDGNSLSSGARTIIDAFKSKHNVCPVILGSPNRTISSSLLSSI